MSAVHVQLLCSNLVQEKNGPEHTVLGPDVWGTTDPRTGSPGGTHFGGDK